MNYFPLTTVQLGTNSPITKKFKKNILEFLPGKRRHVKKDRNIDMAVVATF